MDDAVITSGEPEVLKEADAVAEVKDDENLTETKKLSQADIKKEKIETNGQGAQSDENPMAPSNGGERVEEVGSRPSKFSNSKYVTRAGTLVELLQKHASFTISSLLIVGGITTMALMFVLQDRSIAKFVKYKKEICAKKNPSIVDINICTSSSCTFDTSLCEQLCPFAYVTDNSGCPASCECADEGIYQGDIQYDSSDIHDLAKIYGYVNDEGDFGEILSDAIKINTKLWRQVSVDGRYKIAYQMSDKVKKYKAMSASFKIAIKRISRRTCIDFVQRTTEDEYVEIVDDGRGCSSTLGKSNRRRHKVSFAKECKDPQVIQHTLTHLIGFDHEHVRPDRDAYIEVLTENIKPDYLSNFKRLKKYEVPNHNVPYDSESIMHYDSSSFVKSLHLNSLVLRSIGKRIERKKDMDYTQKDAVEIDMAYKCMDDFYLDQGWTNWDRWSPCDSTCGKDSEKHRYRKCEDSRGRYAIGCFGDSHQTKRCVTGIKCPFEDEWLPWGPFGECTGPCGSGIKRARRKCTTEGKCGSWDMDTVECDSCGDAPLLYMDDESRQYEMWGPWGVCSAPCDGQRRREKKDCTQTPCEVQEENCNVGLCRSAIRSRGMLDGDATKLKGISCKSPQAEIGDFDGDGKNEILCWDDDGNLLFFDVDQSGNTVKKSVETTFACRGNRDFGDFNGDGKLDLMCGDIFDEKKSKVLLSKDGRTFGDEITAASFCNGVDDMKYIRDFDDDKDSDILCHYFEGRIEVLIN